MWKYPVIIEYITLENKHNQQKTKTASKLVKNFLFKQVWYWLKNTRVNRIRKTDRVVENNYKQQKKKVQYKVGELVGKVESLTYDWFHENGYNRGNKC